MVLLLLSKNKDTTGKIIPETINQSIKHLEFDVKRLGLKHSTNQLGLIQSTNKSDKEGFDAQYPSTQFT